MIKKEIREAFNTYNLLTNFHARSFYAGQIDGYVKILFKTNLITENQYNLYRYLTIKMYVNA